MITMASLAQHATRPVVALVGALMLGTPPAFAATPRHAALARDTIPAYRRPDRVVLAPGVDAAAYRPRFIPSFSRQTGLACSACHYGFPELTPFGRLFKLNGYTLTGLKTITGGDTSRPSLKLAPIPPASAMAIISLTHVRTDVPGQQNGAASFPDQASVFLGGQVTPRVGAFVQFTYDAQSASVGLDNTEFRFANRTQLASRELLYGVTLHNNPTMQDVWNTAPAWSFPFTSSSIAPAPTAATLIDGALGQQVLGLGAYGLWNELVYAEFTTYRSAPQGGIADAQATDVVHGVVPYWRVALQHAFGPTYVMVGTYGMVARLFPTGIDGLTDRYTDVGIDGQLEHQVGKGAIIVRSAYIHEKQSLAALVAQDEPGAANASNTLHTARVSASYVPSTRLTLTAGWFDTGGTRDTLLYAPGDVSGSATGRPTSDGAIGEVDFNAWQNTRLGVQYVAYGKFNGASTAYDGTRSASANNTLYVFAWIAF